MSVIISDISNKHMNGLDVLGGSLDMHKDAGGVFYALSVFKLLKTFFKYIFE